MFNKFLTCFVMFTALISASSISLAVDKSMANYGMQQRNIVDVAIQTGSFNSLINAIQAADLVEVLKSDGPFTVFAPSDKAFAKLPPETLTSLLKPENKAQLIAILTNHIIPGKIRSPELITLNNAKTIQGQNIKIHVIDSTIMINNANITLANIRATNGIVHMIDTIILPKQ